MFRLIWKWHNKRKKCVRKDQANYLFQSISGSKIRDWNFQSVKCLDDSELVQQYGGRKSGGWEAEFQERIQKEWACLYRGGSFLGFELHCRSVKVALGGGLDSENSNSSLLRQVRKWKAEIPDTPLGLTGIGKRTEGKISIVQSIHWQLGFSHSLGGAKLNEAIKSVMRDGPQSGPSPCAKRCSVWPKWNIDVLSLNAASRTRFSQWQAITGITGHISIIYWQAGDIMSISSTGTAAA